MSNAVGILNLVIGAVYTTYGLMTIYDMYVNRRTMGFSHFGLAWIFMAFTCGPHHLEHGLHVLTTDRLGGGLDLTAVVVGFPAGVGWFLLRLEAVVGGRGDRTVSGTPGWVEGLPTVAATYVIGMVTAAYVLGATVGASFEVRTIPNLLLIVLYVAIAAVLLRTQVDNHVVSGGWSVSGLSLTVVFGTCAVMHGVWALYGSTGRYDIDGHLLTIDVLAVPAAVYFLWVVASLYRGSLADWNATDHTAPQPPSDDLLDEDVYV